MTTLNENLVRQLARVLKEIDYQFIHTLGLLLQSCR